MEVDPNITELQKAIRKTKVELAREMSMDDKIATGPHLFAEGLALIRDVLRGQNPDWSDEEIEAEVNRRLQIKRRKDDAGLYRDANEADEL